MSDDCGYRVESKGKVHKLTFDVAGKEMTFETGRIGRQAGGSVLARTMDTMVYTTVCAERESTPVDFTPLRVDFFARYSSVGQTVGAFHRRDSRGDDTEILVARLIDRPIRPMIAEYVIVLSRGLICCMFMFRGLLLYTVVSLGSHSLLPSRSTITNNSSIAQHHHTNPNPSINFNP